MVPGAYKFALKNEAIESAKFNCTCGRIIIITNCIVIGLIDAHFQCARFGSPRRRNARSRANEIDVSADCERPRTNASSSVGRIGNRHAICSHSCRLKRTKLAGRSTNFGVGRIGFHGDPTHSGYAAARRKTTANAYQTRRFNHATCSIGLRGTNQAQKTSNKQAADKKKSHALRSTTSRINVSRCENAHGGPRSSSRGRARQDPYSGCGRVHHGGWQAPCPRVYGTGPITAGARCPGRCSCPRRSSS